MVCFQDDITSTSSSSVPSPADNDSDYKPPSYLKEDVKVEPSVSETRSDTRETRTDARPLSRSDEPKLDTVKIKTEIKLERVSPKVEDEEDSSGSGSTSSSSSESEESTQEDRELKDHIKKENKSLSKGVVLSKPPHLSSKAVIEPGKAGPQPVKALSYAQAAKAQPQSLKAQPPPPSRNPLLVPAKQGGPLRQDRPPYTSKPLQPIPAPRVGHTLVPGKVPPLHPVRGQPTSNRPPLHTSRFQPPPTVKGTLPPPNKLPPSLPLPKHNPQGSVKLPPPTAPGVSLKVPVPGKALPSSINKGPIPGKVQPSHTPPLEKTQPHYNYPIDPQNIKKEIDIKQEPQSPPPQPPPGLVGERDKDREREPPPPPHRYPPTPWLSDRSWWTLWAARLRPAATTPRPTPSTWCSLTGTPTPGPSYRTTPSATPLPTTPTGAPQDACTKGSSVPASTAEVGKPSASFSTPEATLSSEVTLQTLVTYEVTSQVKVTDQTPVKIQISLEVTTHPARVWFGARATTQSQPNR